MRESAFGAYTLAADQIVNLYELPRPARQNGGTIVPPNAGFCEGMGGPERGQLRGPWSWELAAGSLLFGTEVRGRIGPLSLENSLATRGSVVEARPPNLAATGSRPVHRRPCRPPNVGI